MQISDNQHGTFFKISSAGVGFLSSFAGLTAAAAAAAAATNAAIAEAMKVKKIKLEVMSSYHANSAHHGADPENGDLSSSVGKSHTVTHRLKFREMLSQNAVNF